MLKIMGYKDLKVTGGDSIQRKKIAEGVAYEVGFAIGKRLVELHSNRKL